MWWYTASMLKSTSGKLVIASIILCNAAAWLVVTGASRGWVVALVAVAALAGSMTFRAREFGEINDQIGDGVEAVARLGLSVPLVILLPLVHVGRYSRFGGWLALAVDGGIVVLFVFGSGILGAAVDAAAAQMRRLARMIGFGHDAAVLDTTGPIEATREVVIDALSTRHEDEAAVRIASIGDADLRTLCERAAWYREHPPHPPRNGGLIPIGTALALAAVELVEGAPRSLRRTRDRSSGAASESETRAEN